MILKLIEKLRAYISYIHPEEYFKELEYLINTYQLDIRHVIRLMRGTMANNQKTERFIMLARGSTKTPKEFLKRFQEEVIKTHPPLPGYIKKSREATT